MATALVIEDDDDIRRLLEVVLSQAGYTVAAAATGTEGLEALGALARSAAGGRGPADIEDTTWCGRLDRR